jgi:PAS domain S-box-containing protein
MLTAAAPAPLPELPPNAVFSVKNESQESMLVLDQNLFVTAANQYFCTWIGLSWDQVEGQPVERFLGSKEASEFLRNLQAGSAVHDFQTSCNIPGVGKRAMFLSGNVLDNGKTKVVLLGLLDITNQNLSNTEMTRRVEMAQRSEKIQRREANLLRSIMESTGDGIFVSDADGNCVAWNPACEQILGVKLDGLKQSQWSEVIGIYLPDAVTPFPVEDLPLSRALKGEASSDVELWIKNEVRHEGLWISVTSRPLTSGQDGAVATFRDITAAKKAKVELAEHAEESARSNRELEQFAYVAAHDLQEPLRMVSSYVQLLARRYKGKLDAEADEFIGFASDGAKRMSLLINDLLTYSRIGRGQAPEELIDCEQVLARVLAGLGQKSLAAGAQITHDPLPKIIANEVQIGQVFQNLIDNAVKFRSRDQPRIHISVQAKNNQWIFSVADNGIGIDDAYKERVFVIFQRLHSRDDYDGTGIGLAVCKKIVEGRDGDIWVEPNHGHGTVVYFTWP